MISRSSSHLSCGIFQFNISDHVNPRLTRLIPCNSGSDNAACHKITIKGAYEKQFITFKEDSTCLILNFRNFLRLMSLHQVCQQRQHPACTLELRSRASHPIFPSPSIKAG